MEPFYYTKMTKQQQAAYHVIMQGANALADEFQIPRIESAELYDVFFRLRLDHPEIFWMTGYKYKYYQDSPNLIFVPEYLFDKNKIREHQRAMSSRVEKLARAAKDLSEWEKEKYIHDFICDNVTYDKLKKAYSHEIIGPLGHGVGVCEGIAKSVKVLCDALGIWCMIAVCGNNPEKGIKYLRMGSPLGTCLLQRGPLTFLSRRNRSRNPALVKTKLALGSSAKGAYTSRSRLSQSSSVSTWSYRSR